MNNHLSDEKNAVDISAFVDTVCTYRCKLCDYFLSYSTEEITNHVMSQHVQQKEQVSVSGDDRRDSSILSGGEDDCLQNYLSASKDNFKLLENMNEECSQNTGAPSVAGLEKMNEDDCSAAEAYPVQPDGCRQKNIQNDCYVSNKIQDEQIGHELRLDVNGMEVRMAIPQSIQTDNLDSCEQTFEDVGIVCNRVQLNKQNLISDNSITRQILKIGSQQTVSDWDNEGLMLVNVGDGASQSESTVNNYELPQLYICGKCDMPFSNVEDCSFHVIEEHERAMNDGFPEEQQHRSDEVAMPPNTTSIGTQAQMYKKPGRKRKVDVADAVSCAASESMMAFPVDESDRSSSKLRNCSNDSANKAMSVLGITRVSTESDGKRRVRPPKALLEDYYILRRKHKKRRQIEPYPLLCEFKGCNARFREQSSLVYHATCHVFVDSDKIDDTTMAVLPFVCPECRSVFASWKILRMHLWKNHKIDSDLLRCTLMFGSQACQYRTDSQQKLSIHQDLHSNLRPHCCQFCGKAFKLETQLKNHEMIHLDSKGAVYSSTGAFHNNKECGICKRIFANKKSLMKHVEIIHEKKKPYVCITCGHESSRKAMLELHLRVHTGEKPFSCDLCNYVTGDHNSLRRHRMRHTGQKPYKCHYCSYSCIQAISLKTHLKSKHPGCEGIYSCDACQYHTVNKQNWMNHMEDHKNNLIAMDSHETNGQTSEELPAAKSSSCSVAESTAGLDQQSVLCNPTSSCGFPVFSRSVFVPSYVISDNNSFSNLQQSAPSRKVEFKTIAATSSANCHPQTLRLPEDSFYVLANNGRRMLVTARPRIVKDLMPVDGCTDTSMESSIISKGEQVPIRASSESQISNTIPCTVQISEYDMMSCGQSSQTYSKATDSGLQQILNVLSKCRMPEDEFADGSEHTSATRK